MAPAAVEPSSLVNSVTHLDSSKRSGVQVAYQEGVVCAVKKFASPNICTYIGAGHVGWLGYPADLTLAAHLYGDAQKPP